MMELFLLVQRQTLTTLHSPFSFVVWLAIDKIAIDSLELTTKKIYKQESTSNGDEYRTH